MTSVTVSGPLFDGTAEREVAKWLDATRKELAQQGAGMLRAFPMDETGRARGGFQARIEVVTRGATEVVHGPQITGVAWSPWLEGTSKRNETTRFKGYHLFRKTCARLQRISGQTAQEKLDGGGYLHRMGGR